MSEFKIVPFSSLDLGQREEIASLRPRYTTGSSVKASIKDFSKCYDIVWVMLKDKEPLGIIAASMGLRRKKKCLNISYLLAKPSTEFYRRNRKTIAEALAEKLIRAGIEKGCTVLTARRPNRHSRALLRRYVERGLIVPIKSRALIWKPYRIKRI